MSFSSGVKEELSLQGIPARHCRIALSAALFHLCPYLTEGACGIRTENGAAASAFEHTLKRLDFDPTVEMSGREITVLIRGAGQVKRFLEMLKLDGEITAAAPDGADAARLVREAQVPEILLQKTCCRRSYLRGLFLAAGSVSDPAKSYHLEIAPLSGEEADRVLALCASLGFGARSTQRKGKDVVYLKEGEQISDFLGAIGATKSLMKLENARILRDIAGNINRQVNFEAANLKKTGIASLRQLEDIAVIEGAGGIGSLPKVLQQAARLRVENPDKSLQELAEMSDPPVGRSGMNHRLQRLSQIAEKIRVSRQKHRSTG